jgi:hypothetical protein
MALSDRLSPAAQETNAMPEPPPPPFETSLSEQAQDDLARWPELTSGTNAVLLRAAKELRRMLESGQNLAADVHGRREHLTVRVSLIPPGAVRIEQIAPGDPVPDGALQV